MSDTKNGGAPFVVHLVYYKKYTVFLFIFFCSKY